MTASTVLEDTKNLFQDLMHDSTIAGSMKKDLDGYRLAMKIEAGSVRLYEDAARKEGNKETSDLLSRIAGEEKELFNILGNLYDFVLAPEYFLAWREFRSLTDPVAAIPFTFTPQKSNGVGRRGSQQCDYYCNANDQICHNFMQHLTGPPACPYPHGDHSRHVLCILNFKNWIDDNTKPSVRVGRKTHRVSPRQPGRRNI